MPHVSINLEDADGGINMRVVHTGGYTPTSPAHRLSEQIIAFLDREAVSKKEITHAPPDESQSGIHRPTPRGIIRPV